MKHVVTTTELWPYTFILQCSTLSFISVITLCYSSATTCSLLVKILLFLLIRRSLRYHSILWVKEWHLTKKPLISRFAFILVIMDRRLILFENFEWLFREHSPGNLYCISMLGLLSRFHFQRYRLFEIFFILQCFLAFFSFRFYLFNFLFFKFLLFSF